MQFFSALLVFALTSFVVAAPAPPGEASSPQTWDSNPHEWQPLAVPDHRLPISNGHVLVRVRPQGSLAPWDIDTDDVVEFWPPHESALISKACLYKIQRTYYAEIHELHFKTGLAIVNHAISLTDFRLSLEGYWGISMSTMHRHVSILSCFFRSWISCSSS